MQDQPVPQSSSKPLMDSAAQQIKKWAVGCNIPVINSVICLLAAVKLASNSFILFHARQGLVLFVFLVVAVFFGSLIFTPFGNMILMGIVLLAHGFGIIMAFQMKEIQIPVLGQLAMKIPPLYIFKKLTGRDCLESKQVGNVSTPNPPDRPLNQ